MGALAARLSLVFLLLAACAVACVPLPGAGAGASAGVDAPLRAPSWEAIAFAGADADFVGAVDLEALRADPLFGPVLARLAREHMGVLLRASQVDVMGSVERGRATSWVAVVHGVTGAPSDRDVGSDSGRFVVATGARAWIDGEGPAFDRLRANPGLAATPIDMPPGALVVATALGRAIPHPRRPELGDLSEGLRDVTFALTGGPHLGFALSCRYDDEASAHRAAAIARLALVAAAGRDDDFSALARALVKLDFDVDGATVSMRVTLSDDLRDALQHYVQRAIAAGE